jgi:large subunit ribosomal protein L4
MKVPVFNMQGNEVASMNIDEQELGGEINASLIKQAYVRYHANQRQGSARSKNRTQVEGSTRKIYKQKGTGNARHGDRKANLFKGGGHGHSKKRTREDFRLDMPKKMRRKANRNALLAKLMDQEVRVVDKIAFDAPKTKAFEQFLGALKIDSTALVALPMSDQESHNARLSGRNITTATLVRCDQINAFTMLNHRFVVIGRQDLENWLSGPTSQTGKSAKLAPMGAAQDGDAAEVKAPKAAAAKAVAPKASKAAKTPK